MWWIDLDNGTRGEALVDLAQRKDARVLEPRLAELLRGRGIAGR